MGRRAAGAGASSRRAGGGDPDRLIEERLRTTYRLTAAEVRVAMRIGRGASPKEVATELGSSWYTVRSQLRQIFAKTERRSQSALTRLVTLLETELALAHAVGRSARSS